MLSELTETFLFGRRGKVSWRFEDGELRVQPKTVWSCPLHDKPDTSYEYCECDYCEGHNKTRCELCETAKYVWALDDDGEIIWEFKWEPNFSLLLRDVYLPPITEALNQTIIFDALEKLSGRRTASTKGKKTADG